MLRRHHAFPVSANQIQELKNQQRLPGRRDRPITYGSNMHYYSSCQLLISEYAAGDGGR